MLRTYARALYLLSMMSQSVGCSIVSKVSYTDDPIRTERSRSAMAGTRTYSTTTSVDGAALRVALTQDEQCKAREVPIYHRHKLVVRHARPSPVAFIIPGVTLLGLGAAVAFGGKYVSAAAGYPELSPLAYYISGGVIGGAGLALTLGGAIHGLKALDSLHDLGEVAGAEAKEVYACNHRPVSTAQVRLILASGAGPTAATDAQGIARFSMAAVRATDVPTLVSPLSMGLGEEVVPLTLRIDNRRELRQAVERDPSSTASQELLAQRRSECDRLARSAEALTVDGTSDEKRETEALEAWSEAQRACGDLFSPERQTKLAAVEATSAENKVARTRAGCLDAMCPSGKRA